MGTLSKEDTEVFVLTSTKMVAIHLFVLFQTSYNLELQVLQILNQAHIHTHGQKQAYRDIIDIHISIDRPSKLFPGN